MKLAFALFLVIHGGVHLLRLTRGHRRPVAALFAVAALSFMLTAGLLVASVATWWIAGAVAVVVSQVAIVAAWSDARLGTIANVLALAPFVFMAIDAQPSSFRAVYRAEVEHGIARTATLPSRTVAEADLAALPPQMQTYLSRVGVVGKPVPRNVHVRWKGQMRTGHGAPWLDVAPDQWELFERTAPTRLFYFRGTRWGAPFDVLHVYRDDAATMRVRIAGVFDAVDARGPEMNRSETVTLFNDMCVFAPATLLAAKVDWQVIDVQHVQGTFTNGGNTVSAVLTFAVNGDLVDFVSNDRLQSADGKTWESFPWSTPLSDYRDFRGLRLAGHGEAMWHEDLIDFVYARFDVEDVEVDATLPAAAPAVVAVAGGDR